MNAKPWFGLCHQKAIGEDPNANDEVADDALRELANTAGGAIKRAALNENVALTTGLPLSGHAALIGEGAGE